MQKTKDFYRRITEPLPQRIYFINFLLLFLSILFILSVILGAFLYVDLTKTKNDRKEVLDNFYYWRQVSEKHPNSPDAFYEAGFYAAELGDTSKAQEFLNEALSLDPSFEKAKALSRQLTSDM